MSNAVHGYVSQSDKGVLVIGAGIDSYIGYGQNYYLYKDKTDNSLISKF